MEPICPHLITNPNTVTRSGVRAQAGDIWVTQPYLPPLEEFIPYLEKIWASRILTNSGPFHRELESRLCEFLGVEHIALFANGTLALITALQALGIQGDVITTPYSFVATSHALVWNGIRPIFVDIDPVTCNIDPGLIEASITENTTAILPVHCYGIPCDTGRIQDIAERHHLKVIYDGAHAFGVRDTGGSILRHGDLSVLSFHATKVFSTFEGGAIVCPDARTKQHIDHLKNFGFVDETVVVETGINGKMSEVNAAMGLLQIKHFDDVLLRRKAVDERYRANLENICGISCLDSAKSFRSNYAYFPILVGDGYPISRDGLYGKLKEYRIHTRRYFYPLISDFPMYRDQSRIPEGYLPNAAQTSEKILCLPIYPDLELDIVDRICSIISNPRSS